MLTFVVLCWYDIEPICDPSSTAPCNSSQAFLRLTVHLYSILREIVACIILFSKFRSLRTLTLLRHLLLIYSSVNMCRVPIHHVLIALPFLPFYVAGKAVKRKVHSAKDLRAEKRRYKRQKREAREQEEEKNAVEHVILHISIDDDFVKERRL